MPAGPLQSLQSTDLESVTQAQQSALRDCAEAHESRRLPSEPDQQRLRLRDGYHCRFCGIPVIRKEVRNLLRDLYPGVIPWGPPNTVNHVALYAMDVQYDHVLPHSKDGDSDLDNIVITCNPCNYGRGGNTLEEMGLADPRTRERIRSTWDGLERLLLHP